MLIKGEVERQIKNFNFKNLNKQEIEFFEMIQSRVKKVCKSDEYQSSLISETMILFDSFITLLQHTVLLSGSYTEAFNIRQYLINRICERLEQCENCFFKNEHEYKDNA